MGAIRSVYEVTQIIKQVIIKADALQGLTVRGEISNFSRPASGHIYFTLKDDRARLRVVMFAGKARFLRFRPADGMSVIVGGSLDVFERSGDYQMYAEDIQPDGLGALFLAFEQLKERLAKEGLFDPARKRALPVFPQRIALVTSATGAAVRDMITTLRRRYPLGHVLVVPVAVQGEEAPPQIANAIERVCRYRLADVMIVGRGGGSLEELFAFNSELVARAIAAADIPVVSAVGHETDTTIADFVADVRAATPTAAAELVSQDARELAARILHLETRLKALIAVSLQQRRANLERLSASRALSDPIRLVAGLQERVDRAERQLYEGLRSKVALQLRVLADLELRMARVSPVHHLKVARLNLDGLIDRQSRALAHFLSDRETALTRAIERLELLSPLSVMKRGYAVVFARERKELVASIDQVQPGDAVRVEVCDGWLDCHIWGVYEKDDTKTTSG